MSTSEYDSSASAESEEASEVSLSLDEEVLDYYRDLFEEADEDGSGKLSATELKEHLRKAGNDVGDAETLMCLQKIDKDGDGELTFNEFCLVMIEAQKVRHETLKMGWKVLHHKGEGCITREKLRRKLKQIHAPLLDEHIDMMCPSDEEIDFENYCEVMGEDLTEEDESSSSYSEPDDYAVGDEPTLEKMKVKTDAYYLESTKYVKTAGKDTLKDFAVAVAKEFDTQAHLMRFYHNGEAMRDFSLRLFDYGVVPTSTVRFITLPNPEPLPHDVCFKKDTPNPEAIYQWFEREGTLSKKDCLTLLKKATDLVSKEPNMLECEPPCVVITDIHGQFFDLKNMFKPEDAPHFEMSHLPGGEVDGVRRNFVFAGDYGDRGYFSMEVVLYIAAAKLAYPDIVKMGRGNHEIESVSIRYGTFWECMVKYGRECTEQLMKLYNALPVCTLITSDDDDENRFLVMHGGLARKLTSLEEINSESRAAKDLKKGNLFYDMMWTDPDSSCQLDDGGRTEAIVERTNWDLNDLEDVSDEESTVDEEDAQEAFEGKGSRYAYKTEAIHYYLKKNNLLSLIRGHQTVREGLYYYEDGPTKQFPGVVSIFSAPNYTDQSMQSGCVADFRGGGDLDFVRVFWSPHPIYKLHNPSKLEDVKTATYFVKDILSEDVIQWTYHHEPQMVTSTRLKDVLKKNVQAFCAGAYPSNYKKWEEQVKKRGLEQADAVRDDQKNYGKKGSKASQSKSKKSTKGSQSKAKSSKAKSSKKTTAPPKGKDAKSAASTTRRRGNRRIKGGGSAKGGKGGKVAKSAKSAKKAPKKTTKNGGDRPIEDFGGGLGGNLICEDGEEAGYTGINWDLVGQKPKKADHAEWGRGDGELDLDDEAMWYWKYVKKNMMAIIATSSRESAQQFVADHNNAFMDWQEQVQPFDLFADTEEVSMAPEEDPEYSED